MAYATKAIEATGHTSRRITTDTIASYASTATHAGRLIRTCWILGHRPDQEHPAEWKASYGRLRWAHMLGSVATSPLNPAAIPPPVGP